MRSLTIALTLLLFPLLAPAATVDGGKVHYTVHGTGAKTVIFVHGWTCNETSWSEQVPYFEKDYRVVTIDLPGHGKSDYPKDKALSYDVFTRAVEAVREEVKAEKVALVGHSMGAAVIGQYAVRYPQRVTALVAVDGGFVFGGPARGGNADDLKGEAGLRARENTVNSMTTTVTPELRARIIKMMVTDTPERTAVEARLAMFGARDTGGPFQFPGLGVYAGRRGRSAPTSLPSTKIIEMEGVGHFLMMEKPAEVNKEIGDFLATVKF